MGKGAAGGDDLDADAGNRATVVDDAAARLGESVGDGDVVGNRGWGSRPSEENPVKGVCVDASKGGCHQRHMGCTTRRNGIGVESVVDREGCSRVPGARHHAEPSDVGKWETCQPMGLGACAEGGRGGQRGCEKTVVGVNDTFWLARGATRRDDQCIALDHGLCLRVKCAASGAFDDGMRTEARHQTLSCLKWQTLVDNEDGVARIPFAPNVTYDFVRRSQVESHEFAHPHSVGWSS